MRYKDATAGPKAMYKLGDNLIFQIYKYSANIQTSVQIHNSIFFMSTSHMKQNYTLMCTDQICFTFFTDISLLSAITHIWKLKCRNKPYIINSTVQGLQY
jgi:hypothetical protein